VRNPSAARSRFALVDALNAEWAELDRDRLLAAHSRAELAHWAVDHPVLHGCAGPAAVLEAIRSDPDPVLAALIGIHQSQRAPGTGAEDHLAGRIVLQAMLGKVVAMAGRDSRHAVEDYVGQLWARIDGYPLARRPHRIAANLALDTLKAVTRDAAGRAAAQTLPVSTDELELAGLAHTVAGGRIAGPDVPEADAVADLTAHRVLRTAQELGLIDEPTRRLLLCVYAEGLSSVDAAARYGLTPATVRFRCSRAVRRMAQHAMTIADAA
jgi:DNA-directed RNA polymerase specialized sigma24 family protein